MPGKNCELRLFGTAAILFVIARWLVTWAAKPSLPGRVGWGSILNHYPHRTKFIDTLGNQLVNIAFFKYFKIF